jgi:predicted metal-binding membrane protein
MLPSLISTLCRYRQAVGSWGEVRPGRLTALVSTAYFLVWTVLGMAAFPVGVTLNELAMQEPEFARAVPLIAGVVVLVAGVLQFTPWKAYYLSCCRGTVERSRRWRPDAGAAWRYGLRLGLHCTLCCAPLTAILLVVGVMDLRAMILVTVAITLERLARAGERVARVTGAVAIGAGLVLIVRAVGV